MKKYLVSIIAIALLSILIIISCKSKNEKIEKLIKVKETKEQMNALEIASYGPKGVVKGQIQIKVDFRKSLIPLTSLSDKERERILKHFIISPNVKGNFRILGTNTVIFEPEHSLPMATEYIVTVKKGLRNIEGNKLKEDHIWHFKTPLPKISIYPYQNSHHIKLNQAIHIYSSIALNIRSLKNSIEFVELESGKHIKYKFSESKKNPKNKEDIGMYRIRYDYILNPKQELKRDIQYKVKLKSGVMTERGNRPTVREFSSSFRTYPAFRFLKVGFCGYCGYKLTTKPYIAFTNNPNWEDFNKSVSIEPKPEKWPFNQYSCCDFAVGINDFLLEPKTKYTVAIGEGLKDIYGQELENPQSATFTTGELTPKMWGPSGYQIITPNIKPILGVKTVNINTVFYKIMRLTPKDILVREQLNYYYTINKLISEIKSKEKKVNIKLSEIGVGKRYFDLKPYLRAGKYGVVAYTFRSPIVPCYTNPITFNGIILRTNIGIYTQFLPTGGIVKLNQLTDGSPISFANVKIYREDDLPRLAKIWDLITNTYIKEITPCFEGKTDSDGLLMLSGKDIVRCTKRRIRNKVLNEFYPPDADPDDILYDQERFGFAKPPRLLIIVEKGNDWTFIQTQSNGNPAIWSFGIPIDWEAERPISRGTIFTDQYLYRPGDTVRIKGVSRFLLYGKLFTGQGLKYKIKLYNPKGAEKYIGDVKVNEFGSFDLDIPTKKGQTLGFYRVVAVTPHHGLKFYGSFRLAEFRVPEFSVNMNIDKEIVLPKEPVLISWEGKYYFGAPMSGVKSSLNITRRRRYFRPKGWEGFSFGVPEYIEKRKVSLSGRYLSKTFNLTKDGKASKSIKLRSDDVPYPMTYHCDVEVEDVSRQTSSCSKDFILLSDNRLIGIKLSDWIVAKNNSINVSVIVSSPEGKALIDIPIVIKLIRREYHSVKTKTSDGKFRIERSEIKKTVETKEVISGKKPIDVKLTPKETGAFIVMAELKKKPDNRTSAATSLWVAGEDYVPWEGAGEDKLEIIMDKKEYKVGDEAVVFVKSPFPEAELFLTVCREKIFLKDTKKIKGSGYTYRFQITEDMLPNAYVGAVLYRLGKPIVPVEEEEGKHIEKIGFIGFNVSISDKYLNVKIKPSQDKLRPSEELNVDIQVTCTDKKIHKSELTVIIVDEAVLSLTGYKPPDLVGIVYRHRGLSARINDNRPFIITEEDILQKGSGYGGGLMQKIVGPKVRSEFLKLAYYNPNLITDKNGKAHFKFKMPDNLTTWKIMVVAIGKENLFGYADKKIIVSQPFILRPVLPRFARIGDELLSGVAVTNLTKGDGSVDIKAEISGNSLIFKDNEVEKKGVHIKAGESKTVLFPFIAKGIGESKLKFTANFNGIYNNKEIEESDALQIPFTVRDILATETVVSVGETKNRSKQKIKIGEGIREDVGGLNILLSSTALTNIGEGAKYLVDYPYGCLEQTLSRLLALIQLKFLSEKYGFSLQAFKPVDKVIEANIRKIILMQNTDGGFKYWPTSNRSDCFLSPYVAYLIKRGSDLDYGVPKENVNRLLNFLDNTLRNPCYRFSTWQGLAEYRINILMGMHHLGHKDETYFEEYFNRRNELSYGAQINLTFLLFQSSNWKKEAYKLLDEIKNGMFVTAQTAHFESPREIPRSWLFMYSPVITTAEGIKLFLEMDPESEYIAKMARYILNARKNGRWRNTYENAKAIDGLVDISLKREAKPPEYTSTILIAGEEMVKHLFKGYTYKPQEKFVPISKLPKGLNDIIISKKGSGRLYYTLSYSYRLKGPQPSRTEGFSIKRTVRNKDTEKVIVEYGKKPPKQVKINAGDIIEVELEFLVHQTGYHLIIDDPIPAGLEAIDASLKTTSTRYKAGTSENVSRGSWRNPIEHTELRDDRVGLYVHFITPGIYKYKYLLRATSSGVFFWPGARISLMYEPEQFGRSSEGFISIQK